MKKANVGSLIFRSANGLTCFILALTCLYPFIYTLSVSLSGYEAIGLGKVILLPVDMKFDIYGFVFENRMIGRSYLNSIVYTVTYTALVLFLCSMAGFVLADNRFRLTRLTTVFFLSMMFFSGGLIPAFLWIRSLGMVNTIWAVILPTAVSPYYIFIFRTAIKSNIPQSLKDAVYMDGGGDLLVYTRIVLPLVKPILATIGLFAAASMWNEFFRPMVYLFDNEKMPLTIVLRRFLILRDFGGNINATVESLMEDYDDLTYLRRAWLNAMKSAIVIVTVVPILLVYPFIQRFFIKGIMIGAIRD